MFNRRNAFLGWLAWNVGKRVIRRKARQAVPAISSETRRPNRSAVVALLAVLGLGGWFAKKYVEGEAEEAGDELTP